MKKFIAYIILISFIFVPTGLSTVSIAAESAQSSNVVNKTDDTFMDFDWIAWHGMFF